MCTCLIWFFKYSLLLLACGVDTFEYLAAIHPIATYKTAETFLGMPTKKRLCRKPAPAALQIMISSFLPRPPCSASKQIGVYVPAKYQLWNDIGSYGVWLWLRMSSHEWGRLRSDDEKILSLQQRSASALEATSGKPLHKPRLSLTSRLMRHISNKWAAMMWSLLLS